MNTIHSRLLDLPGLVAIHCLEAGRPGQPLLIFLHGKKFSAATWQELGTLALAAEAGFHVLALDMPGFGKTEPASCSAASVLTQVLAAQQEQKAAFIGPSMGGRIALEFAIDNPDKVTALVLAGPVGVRENAARLASIHAPTLAVWGEADQVAPPADGELLRQSIPGALLKIYPQAPHPCYLAQPQRWHEDLLRFLSFLTKPGRA